VPQTLPGDLMMLPQLPYLDGALVGMWLWASPFPISLMPTVPRPEFPYITLSL